MVHWVMCNVLVKETWEPEFRPAVPHARKAETRRSKGLLLVSVGNW